MAEDAERIRLLWQAVLLAAIADARATGDWRWFWTKDADAVADAADVDPDYMRARLRRLALLPGGGGPRRGPFASLTGAKAGNKR